MAPGLLPIIAALLAGCNKVVATVHQPWTTGNRRYPAVRGTRLRQFGQNGYDHRQWAGRAFVSGQ